MRSYPFVTRAAITSFLIVVATVALKSGIAAAPAGDESVNHCTIGEAEAAFQAWVPAVKLWNGLGIDQGALGEGYWLCQYRSFRDGAEVCFCEDDIFLGGSTLYELLEGPDALSRPEARESIAAWEFRVFITPDGGQESELDVMRTAIKGGLHPVWGRVVYQQRGVFLQLPPGDYSTREWDYLPGWGEYEATVRVRVLPHETAHLLGPPSVAGLGSVQCPEE